MCRGSVHHRMCSAGGHLSMTCTAARKQCCGGGRAKACCWLVVVVLQLREDVSRRSLLWRHSPVARCAFASQKPHDRAPMCRCTHGKTSWMRVISTWFASNIVCIANPNKHRPRTRCGLGLRWSDRVEFRRLEVRRGAPRLLIPLRSAPRINL